VPAAPALGEVEPPVAGDVPPALVVPPLAVLPPVLVVPPALVLPPVALLEVPPLPTVEVPPVAVPLPAPPVLLPPLVPRTPPVPTLLEPPMLRAGSLVLLHPKHKNAARPVVVSTRAGAETARQRQLAARPTELMEGDLLYPDFHPTLAWLRASGDGGGVAGETKKSKHCYHAFSEASGGSLDYRWNAQLGSRHDSENQI
jgi:hypothetical protein